MEVIIRDSAEEAVALCARLANDAVAGNPKTVLGLATGRTMESVYGELARRHREEGTDYTRVCTFNLDEYIGLAPEDENSYHYYMKDHLFEHIDIPLSNTHLPNGAAEDIDGECLRYEKAIQACGGIDVQLLGIGVSGHIGFNEPLSSLGSRTRPKALTQQTIEQNQTLFPRPEMMPRRAITMGVGTILDARRCLLLATGKEKAEIIARAVEGPITAMVSASALQLHPRCTVIVDQAAAANLQQQEYYHWLFDNEPEWQAYHEG
jgi:glucosamine-6-phosphate deaminase